MPRRDPSEMLERPALVREEHSRQVRFSVSSSQYSSPWPIEEETGEGVRLITAMVGNLL
jgi:hypothetical protein